MTNNVSPKSLLKMARELRGWSQSYVAEQIGAPASTYISRWERGVTLPSPYYREKLCLLFGMNTYELGLLDGPQASLGEEKPAAEGILEAANSDASPLWNIPHHRNPFFTGREHILSHLHDFFASRLEEKGLSLFALSGLPGIGKTQTVVEYAYRYHHNYQTIIWIRADSQQTLLDDFVAVAHLLQLPEREERNNRLIVSAVKRWLEQEKQWLLILDNVGDVEAISSFLPQRGNGHVVFTTRMRATGSLAAGLEIEQMSLEEGALFLLRRTKLLPDGELDQLSDRDAQAMRDVAQLLDGLPLALDQAGAYIEETLCNFPEYFHLYQEYRVHLLQRRGRLALDHPESVATTLSLCIEKIQQKSLAAADLLYFCAFLDAEAIPEELFLETAGEISPLLKELAQTPVLLNEIFSELLHYSFLHRDLHAKTFTIHRLVQSILRDFITLDRQVVWATRVVKTISKVFPAPTFSNWPICQRYLMHAQVCAQLITDYHLQCPEAAQLLYRVGCYLLQRANYRFAERSFEQALHLYRQLEVSEHVDVAACLNKLATVYHFIGKTEQGKELLQQAIDIYELRYGPEHTTLAGCLNDLAMLYYYQQAYAQAELLAQRALNIWEKTLQANDPDIASGRNNLAKIYLGQGKREQAEPLFQQALATLEKARGSRHPDIAFVSENLARLYQGQGKYALAESFYKRAISIREEALGKAHPRLAESLQELASLYQAKEKYAQAEQFYQRALKIWENSLGKEHPKVASTLQHLVELYTTWGKHQQAEEYRHKLPVSW